MKRALIFIIISLLLFGLVSAKIIMTSKATEDICSDSDNGKDYFLKGTTTKGVETQTDECAYCTGLCIEEESNCKPNCGAVLEFYCEENTIKNETHVCNEGETCEEGACIIKENDEECISEGNFCDMNFRSCSDCCTGLKFILCDKVGIDNKCEYGCLEISYCTKCGDGQCKSPENKCNCPRDCGGAICGNGICEEREASSEQWLNGCNRDDQTYCDYKLCDEDCGEQINYTTQNQEECEEWACTNWGRCINEMKTRNCVQASNLCPGEQETPKISKRCEEKEKIKIRARLTECPESCECSGSTIKCILQNGREMTIHAGKSGNIIVQVKGVNMSTNVTLYRGENGTLHGIFNGKEKRIKMLPDQVKEKIREKIARQLENENIQLNEDGTYQYEGKERARLFAFIPVKVMVRAELDPETGEVIRLRKTWWAVFTREEGGEIVGASCGTVTPGYNDQCCKDKGYDVYNQETAECEFNSG